MKIVFFIPKYGILNFALNGHVHLIARFVRRHPFIKCKHSKNKFTGYTLNKHFTLSNYAFVVVFSVKDFEFVFWMLAFYKCVPTKKIGSACPFNLTYRGTCASANKGSYRHMTTVDMTTHSGFVFFWHLLNERTKNYKRTNKFRSKIVFRQTYTNQWENLPKLGN